MAKHPKKPLSPYDPKYKEPKMAKDYGPFDGPGFYGNGPKRHGLDPNSPRRICYCGDPTCTIGLQEGVYGNGSSGRTATEVSARAEEGRRELDRIINTIIKAKGGGSMSNNTLEIIFREIYNRGMGEDYVPEQYREQYRSWKRAQTEARGGPSYISFDPSGLTKPSGPPASYTKARKAIEEYILTTKQSTDWSDIIGNETAHSALREALEAPVVHKKLYEHYGMKPPKGVLLYGPPGCGKTMFAKAAATAVSKLYKAESSEVILIKGSQLQQPYVGATEEIIRNIFAYAREYAAYHKHPLVIFMDECEVFLPDRTGKGRRVMGWEESNVATMLAELDGLEALGAFTILATNRPEALDEALLRDGRCDRKIKIERPDKAAIYQIVAKSVGSAPLACQADDFAEAVVECFYDPAYVIQHGHVIAGQGEKITHDIAVNFCLEHIVSGAMAQSVIWRAKALAFRRDLAANTVTGIQVIDGIMAVKEIFEENKNLEHSFAVNEFAKSLPVREMLEPKGRVQ